MSKPVKHHHQQKNRVPGGYLRSSCLLLLFALSLSGAAQGECLRTWRLATGGLSNSPFPIISTVQQMGCDIVLVPVQATRNRYLRLLEEGEVDAIAEASKLPEREVYAWFSRPYRTEKIVLFVRKADARALRIKSLMDIAGSGMRINGAEGGWFGPEVQALLPLWRERKLLVSGLKIESGLKALRSERFDILIGSDLTKASELEPDLQALPFIVYSEPVHVMLSKRTVSAAELAAFDRALLKVLAQHKNAPEK